MSISPLSAQPLEKLYRHPTSTDVHLVGFQVVNILRECFMLFEYAEHNILNLNLKSAAVSVILNFKHKEADIWTPPETLFYHQ